MGSGAAATTTSLAGSTQPFRSSRLTSFDRRESEPLARRAGWKREMCDAFTAGVDQAAREPGILIEAEVTAVVD